MINNTCGDYALASTLALIKQFFTIICIEVPIILIIMIIITLGKMVINPDTKNGLKSIITKIIAALVIFFLPTTVNLVMDLLEHTQDNEGAFYNVATCWDAADSSFKYIKDHPYVLSDNFNTFSDLMNNYQEIEHYVNHNTSSGNGNYASADGTAGMGIPRYYQGDYANVVLGGDRTVATSGCGFTSAAMVVSYLTGENITPAELVDDWSRAYYIYNGGMSWGFPSAAARHYNLGSVTAVGRNSTDAVINALRNNQPVMCSQGPGLFTRGGHIIVLSGITSDGKIIVNDPNSNNAINKDYNNRPFDISEINAAAKQYWIFEAKS